MHATFELSAYRYFVVSILLSGSIHLTAYSAQLEVPTDRKPVTDEYYGMKVADDYRWLENASDPAVREWSAGQNVRTRAWLDKSSVRNALAAELQAVYEESSPSYSGLTIRGGKAFVMRLTPPAQQPVLLMFASETNFESAVTIVDPNTLETNGTIAIDWYVPSHDGKRVAVCLSRNGSEEGTLRFFDTTGKELGDSIPRVQFPTAGGSATWNSSNSGAFYTRYPAKGDRPDSDLHFFQQVWFHELGTPISKDIAELTNDLPRIAEIALSSSENGHYVMASVANGDGGDFAHFLRNIRANGQAQWRQITRFEDGIKAFEFGRDKNKSLLLLSRQDAPRGKILHLSLAAPDLPAGYALIKESDGVIEGYDSSPEGIYVAELVGGPSRIRYFDWHGRLRTTVQIPPVSTVGEMAVRGDGRLIYRDVSYTQPFAYYLFDPATMKSSALPLAGKSPVKFDDVEVVREMATSRDGTKVPLNIIRRKGTKLDGNNPTLLYGYGGYGVSLTPSFDPSRRIWLDAGGVMVIANLRGGGELGEEWHKGGNLTKKQNVFDDFIACAEWLIKNGYTNPQKLAIEGASNGGLLMGAALTQRPDLFRAVVSRVGIYDMLRVETEPNGVFNVTEFGTVKDPKQFQALYAYSPYHHVTNGVPYPAVLMATGENDGRVNPSNSRKMIARLQAATSGEQPILLRTSAGSGHGMGSSMRERIAEKADILAFLIEELGATWKK